MMAIVVSFHIYSSFLINVIIGGVWVLGVKAKEKTKIIAPQYFLVPNFEI